MTAVDRLNGVTSGVAVKAPVKAATTANITLSGEQTIDGVSIVSGDRVLVKSQTDTTENGIYNASIGAWSRAVDFDGVRDVVEGTIVSVNSGTLYADTIWRVDTSSPSPGSAMDFSTSNMDTLRRDLSNIISNSITPAMIQQVATQRVYARNTAGTGNLEAVTGTQVMDWMGSTRGMINVRGASTWAGLAIGAKGKVLTSDGTDLSYANPPLGARAFSNLVITVTSTTALSLTASWLVVENAAGTAAVITSVSKTLATGTSGAGGLDTGAIANSTWYAVWVIMKDDGTTNIMLSTSGTSPTMPTGYTFKARMGWVITNTSAGLRFTLQRGNKAVYSSGTNARQMTSGASGNPTTPTWTTLSVSSFVPTTASEIILFAYTNATSGATAIVVAPNNTYGGWLATSNQPPLAAGYGTSIVSSIVIAPVYSMVLESTNIYYATAGTNSYLNCLGWVDSL